MTLKNHMAPLLCYFKLFASWHSYLWIQAGITAQKQLIWVTIINFSAHVILKFNRWPWKAIGHLFYATSSFVHHFVAIWKFKLELRSRNAQICFDLCDLHLWPWPFAQTSLFVSGNKNFMMIWQQEHCEKCMTDRWTDKQTDRHIYWTAWSQRNTLVPNAMISHKQLIQKTYKISSYTKLPNPNIITLKHRIKYHMKNLEQR